LHLDGCDLAECNACGEQIGGCLCDAESAPFFDFPTFCSKCGKVDPDFFLVSDEEWNETVPFKHRNDVICWECYCFMRSRLNLPESIPELSTNDISKKIDEIAKLALEFGDLEIAIRYYFTT
jgi:hypothetical protein